ncbi:MAG TPA: general stress protein [Armatimonadota bacterium]|jgi:hypothetical protein
MPEQMPEQPRIGRNVTVAIYPTHEGAEAAIKELERSGFDIRKLSVVGKDYHTEEHVTGYYTTGDRMMAWGKFGAFWGGVWGLLFGSAFFVIPGIGPLLMAGPVVAAIISVLDGAVVMGGANALNAALVSMGVPRESANAYETDIAAGKYVLIVDGTREETARAKVLLHLTRHEGVTDHSE